MGALLSPTEEAVDIADLLLSLDDPACEWRKVRESEPCAAPADWLMLASCGHHAYFHEAHAARVKASLDRRASKALFCSRHEIRVELEWRPVR